MNKIILVTGDRKGIGRKISEYYLSKGAKVIGCSRSGSELINDNYLHVRCDVSDEVQVRNVVYKGLKKFGRIDVLINNAGIASLNHSILTPSKTVKRVFETNYFGTFYFSREVSKIMMKKKFGRVINFSTVAVPLNLEGEMVYSSSKVAIEKMAKIMSKELSKFNITFNTIGPTPVDTDLIRTVPKDKIEEILQLQTINRIGNFDDVINVINFFISDESSFITGQKIYLGGL